MRIMASIEMKNFTQLKRAIQEQGLALVYFIDQRQYLIEGIFIL